MRISREQKIPFRVKTALETIIARLDKNFIRHDEKLSLDNNGFGHAWIKYYREDRKAGYIFICSHSDNMDPECCDPIYRFIKVYNYCDDVLDDNFLGETAVFSHLSISDIESYETWDDNVSQLLSKNGVAWIYIKDPETGKPAVPYTTYPTNIEGVTENWEDSWIFYKNNNFIDYLSANPNEPISAINLNLKDVIIKDDTLYLARVSGENLSLSANNTDDNYPRPVYFSIRTQNINPNNNFSVCPICNGVGKYITGGTTVNCPHCNTDTNTKLKLESDRGFNQYSYPEWIENYKKNNINYTEDLKTFTDEYKKDHSEASFTQIEDAFFLKKLQETSNKTVYNSIIPISYLNGVYKYAPGYSFKHLNDNLYEVTVYTDMFKRSRSSEFIIDPVKLVIDITNLDKNNECSGYSYEENRNSLFEFTLSAVPSLSALSACGDYTQMDPEIYERKYHLVGFQKDYTDKSGNFLPIYPISTSALYQDQYINPNNPAQELNYFTHCKTNTFDYPWNYNEVMNFILYKDENLHITPNYDKLLMADDQWSSINWSLKGQTRNCNLYCPLDTHKIAFSPCEPDNCASVNGRNLTYNLDTNGDIQYNNIAKQIQDDGNFYHYNQLIYNKESWPGIGSTGGNDVTYNHHEGSDVRAYPVYEGIYYKNIPGTYESYDSYAWLRTSAREADSKAKDYFTGNLDTIEFKKDYENHHFLFLDKHPIKSIYYKEQFVTSGENENSKVCGGYGQITNTPGWNINNYGNTDNYNLSLNYYPIKGPHAYNLYGVSAYRHVCPTCYGIGVKGVTLHSTWMPNGNLNNNALPYHANHEWRCPTCAGRGVRIRYMYFDHDLLTSGHNSVYTDDRRAKELLYETSGDPYTYWYYDGINFNKVAYNYNNLFNYIDVSGVDLDSDDKVYEPDSGYHSTAFSAGQMFRWKNNMDEIIGFSAFEPTVGAWSRIYFDNDYIRKKWDITHEYNDIMAFKKEKIYIDKKDHDHDIEDHSDDLKRDRYEDSFNTILNYHSTSALNEKCPICDGKGTILVQDADEYGNLKFDFYKRPIMKEVDCPTCAATKQISKTYDEHYRVENCSKCNGTGKEECPSCHGTGKTGEEDCKICNGSGEIKCRSCNGIKLISTAKETSLVAPDRNKEKYIWKVRNKQGISCDNLSVELYPYESEIGDSWNYSMVNNNNPVGYAKGVLVKEERNEFGNIIPIKTEDYTDDNNKVVVAEDFEQGEMTIDYLLTEDEELLTQENNDEIDI